MFLVLLFSLFLCQFLLGYAQVYELIMLSNPGGCIGGEVCITQPSVAVTYRSSGGIAYSFQGSAYVQIGSSPSGYEKLYYGSSCTYTSCGQEAIGSQVSVTFVDGMASFKNLYIREAGTGYTLRFVGRDNQGREFSFTYSSEFEVTVGPKYKLSFQNFTGNAFGGQIFSDNPVVSVVDRGGNVVTGVNAGVATVSLLQSPTGKELLRPVSQLSVTIKSGFAVFKNLFINEAGFPYQLSFGCAMCDNLPSVTSQVFHVAEGNPASILISPGTDPADNVIQGGEYFRVPPAILIYDVGGNHIISDNSSAVEVSIYNNPFKANILPSERLFVVSKRGKIQFTQLIMDTAGYGYTLKFTLYSYSSLTGMYTNTNITVISRKFSVSLGPARKLILHRPAGGAWAGQQGFWTQPQLFLTDYGNNIISTDFSTEVSMKMANSLSVSKQIVIDTSTAPQTKFSAVYSNWDINTTYGVGEELIITIECPYHISVLSDAGNQLPYLLLNINNSNVNTSAMASLVGDITQTKQLQFKYIVEFGDIATGQQDILMSNGLQLYNSSIVDGNDNEIDTTIPEHNFTYKVESSAPQIVDFSSNTTSGAYGEGQVIRLTVTFDQPTSVQGIPYLVLTANSTFSGPAIANYSMTSEDGKDVIFDYIVTKDQMSYRNLTVAIPRIEFYNLTINTTLVDIVNTTSGNLTFHEYDYSFGFVTMGETWIRRQSAYPSIDVNTSFSGVVLAQFENDYNIIIDTTAPHLDVEFGVQTNMTDGTYYPGDKIWLQVRYDKPIAWYGVSFVLRLNTGPSTRAGEATIIRLLDDDLTLQFVYIVRKNDNISRLDISSEYFALDILANETYVRRLSTHPTTTAEFLTTLVYNSNSSLRDNAALTLYGYPLVPQNVSVATSPNNVSQLIPDDTIYLSVSFNGPVVASCSPVLVLALNFYREAKYISGNGTHTLSFEYKVNIGDESSFIGYRTLPSALCSTTRCPLRSSCAIYTISESPSVEIDYRLPRHDLKVPVVRLSNTSIVPIVTSRNTSVVKVEFLQPSGEYGVGSLLEIAITFSDIVIVFGSNRPQLHLNIGKYADYSRGSYDDTLIFRYITTEEDYLVLGDLKISSISGSNSAISCGSSCSIINQAEQMADLQISSTLLSTSSGITLDPTNPVVTDVYFEFSHPSSVYTAGDLIKLVVIPSKPVIVGGFLPRVKLRLYPTNSFAVYSPELSDNAKLVFTYRSHVIEKTTNLSYVSSEIDMRDAYALILRLSSIPTTPMNVSLPPPFITPIISQSIVIDSVTTPFVVNVTCRNSSGTYRVGDTLVLQVQFSSAIIALGRSRIAVNVGDHPAYANYIGYVPDNCTNCIEEFAESDFNASSSSTHILLYRYTVGENDVTEELDYIDCASYEILLTANNDPGYIKRINHPVAIDANLTLPMPGSKGSISYYNSNFQIDGRQPHLSSMFFLNPTGIYSIDTMIWIAMEFSAPVVVVGGAPSLLLETGKIKNEAFYYNGSGSATLYFVYQPEPGDFNLYLDYFASRKGLNDASSSFKYNEARILAASQNPRLSAHVYLNPPGGYVKGDYTAISDAGVVLYNDTYITRKGLEYVLFYDAEIEKRQLNLLNSQSIYVSFSSEYQLRPAAALKEEKIGQAVDLQGDIAMIGAPDFNISVTTVQVVEISVANGLPQREVQIVLTTINSQPAIQTFHTSAAVGETIGGYFTISFGLLGPSQPIAANADSSTLAAILGFDIAVLGSVAISVERYTYCACNNAFSWTITFLDYNVGTMGLISVDGSKLTGHGVTISNPVMLQKPSYLAGSFRLSALGKKTTLIPFDATAAVMKSSVEQTGLNVYSVTLSPTLADGTRSWQVTFDAYKDSYEVPMLTADGSGLSGGPGVNVSITSALRGRHGPKGIAGYFQLYWRGNTTRPLLPSITAAEMKEALEDLPIINTVLVNRTLITPDIGAYSWTIEFLSVNYHNSRGYYEDDISNLEPLEPINNLIATDAHINIDAKWEIGSRNRLSSKARQGTFGQGAGAVFVYQRLNDSWLEIATLRGNDTSENNKFGGSLSLDNDVVAVGAIGANVIGAPEKQSIHCYATDGYFYISFRGWSTDLISCNVTREELLDAMVSPSQNFNKLHPITSLTIDDWGGGPLCANKTAVLTFYRPVDGAKNLFDVDIGADLELLTLTDYNLSASDNDTILEVNDVQKGTWVLHGVNADRQQIGAVYLFRQQKSCTNDDEIRCLKNEWKQEAKLFPPTGAPRTLFSYALALESNVLVVGAPGSLEDSGIVYIYEYSESASEWRYFQLLKDPENAPGSHFGHAIAKSGSTIAISSLSIIDNTGLVYIYTRSTSTGPFIATQFVTASAFSGREIMYGADVALFDNVLVVGVPAYNASSIYLGSKASSTPRSNSGAVIVFQRPTVTANYLLKQVLTPSNVDQFSNFGSKVAVEANVIIASSLEKYAGPLLPSKPVVSIQTKARYNAMPLGGSFKIQWLKANDTTGTNPGLVTRSIPHDALDVDLKRILEDDLPLGDVMVTRSRVDLYDGGYEWLVTFMRYPSDANLFGADFSALTGSNATVEVTWVNKSPIRLRSNTHYFERVSSSSPFIEQMFLHPYKHQSMDRCGTDLALSGQYALVGCPNRDQDVVYRNSGAGFIYDLSLVSLEFEQNTFTIKEGEDAVFTITRDAQAPISSNDDIFYYALTLDRNAEDDMQMFISNLFGIANSSLWLGRETFLDRSGLVGKAFARSQFYGSAQQHHRWVDGRYDYRAIADYVPKIEALITLAEDEEAKKFAVTTNPDTIVESPAETITSIITTPGLWPSLQGKLISHGQLDDQSTGNKLKEDRFAKLLVKDNDLTLGGTGSTALLSHECEYLFVTAKTINELTKVQKGQVNQFKLVNSSWTQLRTFSSPSDPSLGGLRFGESLAASCMKKHNVATLFIGEPSINRVYAYISYGTNFPNQAFVLDFTFTIPEAILETHRFGHSIAVDGEVVVIGAPGLETVYVYRHIYNTIGMEWYWSSPTILRSSDYDYDVLSGRNNQVLVHRQEFGCSVAISGRSILVGAPYADYQNLGRVDLVENYDTEGVSVKTIARGKAYLFYSTPTVDKLCLNAQQVLSQGQFKLIYEAYGINMTTINLFYNATTDDVFKALTELQNVDDISVSRSEKYFNVPVSASRYGSYEYCWTITYHTPFTQPGKLSVEWFDTGCANCTDFDYEAAVDAAAQFSLESIADIGVLNEINTFNAVDGSLGARFGWSVAIDNNQLVVGAPHAASLTSTTWDFEAGELLGWSRTGTAFDYQPTFGDNAKYRASYGQQSSTPARFQSTGSGLRGQYYISTYDKHPDADLFALGSTQGVLPTGTLSSDVFMILGDRISFLLGGGCDLYLVYVELLVDGFSVSKVTGKCAETMILTYFDVSHYHNRAGQIRIVDNSTDTWGYISVDEFKFDWEVHGATVTSSTGKTTHGGMTETTLSGAAYLYTRINNDLLPCTKPTETDCHWVFERKLLPSDKRENAQFGHQVAVMDKYGLVAVSAPNAPLFLSYKDTPTLYPNILSFVGESSGAGLQYPVQPHNISRFQSIPSYHPQASGSSGVWQMMNEQHITPPISVNSGAIYIYTRSSEILAYTGQKAKNGSWLCTEVARIQPSDLEPGDTFGASLSSSKELGAIIVGAPGFSSLGIDQGAAYYFKIEFASVKFQQVNFLVKEEAQAVATVTLVRDLSIYSGQVVLEYATNDLTARGVDSNKFQACLRAPTADRAALGCGDYEHTAGLMVIEPGIVTGGFTVNIMDDYCYERDMKYIQLTLSVPGSSALQGEQYQAMIRIDDDDFNSKEECRKTIV